MSAPNARTPPAPAQRPSAPRHRTLDLALQGGGSHGAFTWGVLDRLLEEDKLEIAAISGTSAGAMNAVALAAGLMDGGREGARRVLRDFWQRVSQASPFHHLQNSPMGTLMGPAADWLSPWIEPWTRAASLWGQQLSPYQFNPLNLNPLRDILVDTVDFERVRRCHKTKLFIAATQVRTGALRLFDQCTLNVDHVLASACLPLMFQAVEIDGEGYWDGGYAGNPSLMPLITESPADDLLLVQINPIERASVPTSAGDILDRINEVTFNASLVKEMRSIALLKQLIADEGRPLAHAYRHPLFQRVEALRVHLIDGGASLAQLGVGSKTSTHWGFLSQLHDLGAKAADSWITEHGDDIGVRSSLDLSGALAS